VHSVWVSPREAIERGNRGEIELIFPTRSTLSDLAAVQTPRAALEHARSLGDIEVNAACWALDHEGSQRLFRRADPPYFEIHWSDPEEKGDTCFVIQPGIPKRLDRFVTRLTAPNPGVSIEGRVYAGKPFASRSVYDVSLCEVTKLALSAKPSEAPVVTELLRFGP